MFNFYKLRHLAQNIWQSGFSQHERYLKWKVLCCCLPASPRLTGREPLVFLPGPFSNEPSSGKAHLKQCEQMTLTRRQKRLCRREPGLAETLRESVRLSLLECRYQFRSERWNCSLDGRGSLLKRGEAHGLYILYVFKCLLYVCLSAVFSDLKGDLV